ncbi:MAG: hypothetical protein WCT40_03110 [Candidatus Magasanikbacteria bacterium]|jgi:hypothetical protein
MIAHRLQTHQPEPSVKFYRTIAVSFLALTIVLLGVVIFITSKKATVTVLAKEDVKNVSFNVALESGAEASDGSRAINGGVDTADFYWSQKYSPTGNKTVEGVSKGKVIIYNKTNAAQTLVKTTRLLTPGNVLFRLTDRVLVPANGEITAEVYSDLPGSASDIGPSQFTIPGLDVSKQRVIYAESKEAMNGGMVKSGVITDDDYKSAQADYWEKAKQAYLTSKNAEFSGKKVIATLSGQLVSSHKTGEEVSEFELFGTSTVVVAWYDQAELDELLNKTAGSKIDPGSEKILSLSGDPQVSIASYDLARKTAQLAVTQNAIVTLDANADKLSVGNFLGRSKDEIQRYVLGLDHVTGVEVKFSPVWMMSAPSVPEKIQVIVKNFK